MSKYPHLSPNQHRWFRYRSDEHFFCVNHDRYANGPRSGIGPLGGVIDTIVAGDSFRLAQAPHPGHQIDRDYPHACQELVAEAMYRAGQLDDLAALILSSPDVRQHIDQLNPANSLHPELMQGIQHYARTVLARQAAQAAVAAIAELERGANA